VRRSPITAAIATRALGRSRNVTQNRHIQTAADAQTHPMVQRDGPARCRKTRAGTTCHSRKNRSGLDSRGERKSEHDPMRCLRSSTCLEHLSSICSSRGAGLKLRTSFCVRTLTALAVSNGGSNEVNMQSTKRAKLDAPNVANTSCLGRGDQCQSDGAPGKAHRSAGTESLSRK
jgi:hypothetical protein